MKSLLRETRCPFSTILIGHAKNQHSQGRGGGVHENSSFIRWYRSGLSQALTLSLMRILSESFTSIRLCLRVERTTYPCLPDLEISILN
jgi:hypothetical protein